MKRRPAVSGQFYYANLSKLRAQVEACIATGLPEGRRFSGEAGKEKVIGVLSPHAGLMYSGAVAGAVYSRIKFPHTFILIGPNHTGFGTKVALMSYGEWEIPLGTVKIDEELSGKILTEGAIIEEDAQAHLFEHSLEVQLPFILYFSQNVMIVPITMMSHSLEDCMAVGEAIAKAVEQTSHSVVIVASSDMSHYEPDDIARQKDKKAIERILDLDPEGLHRTVMEERISMCGFAPATAMLSASKALGAREAELIKYMTSGEVSGDFEHVVGYAGVIVR